MSNTSGKTTVISLGGSLITTESGIDGNFLQQFHRVIQERIPERTFYIITGGGSTARKYQQALQSVAEPSDEDLDWMGIHSTRLNGQLLRLIFADTAHEELVLTPEAAVTANESVVIGAAGNTPGRSSDYGSLTITEAVDADHLIELSDVPYIYAEDPKDNPEAEAFDKQRTET
jgi:uridylate kinase